VSLWGCQLGGGFLDCAGHMYSADERALLGAIVIAIVSAASFALVKLVNPR